MATTDPTERLLNTEEAAEFLGLRPVTLEMWRWYRKGPPYRKHGRRILYALSELTSWSDSQRVTPGKGGEARA